MDIYVKRKPLRPNLDDDWKEEDVVPLLNNPHGEDAFDEDELVSNPGDDFEDRVADAADRMVQKHGVRQGADLARHYAYNNYDPGEYGYRFWSAVADAIIGTGRPIVPNRRARALGERPSMDTRFGDTLDDIDSIGGARGSHLDSAMSRYETFHAKAPIRVAELAHELPDRWDVVGDALAVMYRTDKWKKDGVDEDYKHLHDKGDDKPYEALKGVRFYEPSRSGRRLPVSKPKAITLLGYCLGFFVRKDDDGQEYETNPRGCYLFCSPSGDALYLYSPDEQADGSSGFLAAAVGGNLRVLKDGIDG
jgi:hypothetical protein